MTRGEAWLNHVGNLLVGGTGIVYGWMLYLLTPEDPFAVVNHSWQPELHAAHIVTAPLVVFASALLWKRHVWARVRSGFPQRRKTGLTLFALLFPMIASGYLLQVSVEESWLAAWTWTHVASSCLWVAAYLVHQLSPRAPLSEAGPDAD